MKLRYRVVGYVVSAAMHLIAILPLPLLQAAGKGIGLAIYFLNTRAAKVTHTNIGLCLPDLSEADRNAFARESLSHTGQMLMETPAAWLGSLNRIAGWIRNVEGEELLETGLAAGNGVIVLLPHIGNWELINVYIATTRNKGSTGLYAPPNKDYLKPLMAEVRGRFGNELVPTTVKGIATLFRRLDEGKLVVVLPDQVPASGEFAPFFGHDCLTDKLVSRLIQRSRAKVVNCVIRRLPRSRGFDLLFSEPDPDIYSNDLPVSLAGLNASVEACVRQAPAQYQWEYKRFKERPAGELRVYNYENEPWTHH